MNWKDVKDILIYRIKSVYPSLSKQRIEELLKEAFLTNIVIDDVLAFFEYREK